MEKQYAFFRVLNDESLISDFIYLYPDDFAYVSGTFEKNTSKIDTIINCKDSVNDFTYKYNNRLSWMLGHSLDGWGVYKIHEDRIVIQFFMLFTEGYNLVRVVELEGRFLPDNSIEVNREFYNQHIDSFKNRKIDTTFENPIKFKRFDVDSLPNYKNSMVYKSLWYRKYR